MFSFLHLSTPFSVLNCEVSCPENVRCVGCHPAAEHGLFTAFICSLFKCVV